MPPGGRPASAEIARRDPDRSVVLAVAALSAAAVPVSARAMHVSDGVLPPSHCVAWLVASAPFVGAGLRALRRRAAEDALTRSLVATAAALVLVLSSVELPLPLGTSAHACGVGFVAILLGPFLAIVAALGALVLEALLLGHGGVTALGADLASMGIAGAFAGWAAFRALRAVGGGAGVAAFGGGLAASVATYAVATAQLAIALAPAGGLRETALGIALGYAPAQLPIAAIEAFVTSGAVVFLARRRPDVLARLGVVHGGPV